jgi:hypothetical protein
MTADRANSGSRCGPAFARSPVVESITTTSPIPKMVEVGSSPPGAMAGPIGSTRIDRYPTLKHQG